MTAPNSPGMGVLEVLALQPSPPTQTPLWGPCSLWFLPGGAIPSSWPLPAHRPGLTLARAVFGTNSTQHPAPAEPRSRGSCAGGQRAGVVTEGPHAPSALKHMGLHKEKPQEMGRERQQPGPGTEQAQVEQEVSGGLSCAAAGTTWSAREEQSSAHPGESNSSSEAARFLPMYTGLQWQEVFPSLLRSQSSERPTSCWWVPHQLLWRSTGCFKKLGPI